MSRHGKGVEWLLSKLEVVAVFGAMTWALVWIRMKQAQVTLPGWRPSFRRPADRRAFETPGTVGWPGPEDPDGGAAWDRARRRRLVD